MPTPKKGPRLGGSAAHQRLMLRNLATALFEHGRITTTEAKARLLRPYAEKLITKAKKGGLHNRRQVEGVIYTKDVGVPRRDNTVTHLLFTEIADRFKDRPGGYTRITKIGPRKGDNAPMAVIELVTEPYVAKPSTKKKPAPAPAPAPVEEVVEETAEVVEEAAEAPEAVEEAAAEEVADEAADEVAEAPAEESAEETTED